MNNTFDDWPLEALVTDREAFFAFLQERWPVFLDRVAAGGEPVLQEAGGRTARLSTALLICPLITRTSGFTSTICSSKGFYTP